jgi:hypothetical protein
MRVKTCELKGPALDYAVSLCEGTTLRCLVYEKLGDKVEIPEELL